MARLHCCFCVIMCIGVLCVSYKLLDAQISLEINKESMELSSTVSIIHLANTKETVWEPTREMRGFLFGGSDWTFGTFDESITHQWGTSKYDWHILL